MQSQATAQQAQTTSLLNQRALSINFYEQALELHGPNFNKWPYASQAAAIEKIRSEYYQKISG